MKKHVVVLLKLVILILLPLFVVVQYLFALTKPAQQAEFKHPPRKDIRKFVADDDDGIRDIKIAEPDVQAPQEPVPVVPEPSVTDMFSESSLRIGVISYVPHRDNHYYVMQFTGILYSSWRYVTEHAHLSLRSKVSNWIRPKQLVIVDLIIFCQPEACKHLPTNCSEFAPNSPNSRPLKYPSLHQCIYIKMDPHPYSKDYGWINSFVFTEHPDYDVVQPFYDYFFRLDTDCLLTPPFLSWTPPEGSNIIMEHWDYCTDFNRKRLELIASQLRLENQKVHCIGSSFYLKSSLMKPVARLTVNLTLHIASKEFDRTLPGLESIFANNTNPEGIWPTWWRGVSLLYGTELAINAVVPNLKSAWVKGLLDRGTCENLSVLTMVQLHSFQGACQFRKFDYVDSIMSIRKSRILDPRLLIYYKDRDASKMNVREYAQFIAWHGAGHYIEEMKAWTAVAQDLPEPDPQ